MTLIFIIVSLAVCATGMVIALLLRARAAHEPVTTQALYDREQQ